MNEKKIVIVDSGVSNIWSVAKAVSRFAAQVVVTEEAQVVSEADALILPGIGTFKAGMDGLRVRELIAPIQGAAKKNIPILGICLGAQLLLDKGLEFGEHEGLGIIPGTVEHFPDLGEKIKIPAMGWQEVVSTNSEEAKQLFPQSQKDFFYFLHSYVLCPTENSLVLAQTSYGGYDYCAAVGMGSILGVQFHPEKSGTAGLQLIKQFIDLAK